MDPTARFVVGLTGGIGSGKSTVADRFALLGATLVDTDLIAHQLTGPAGTAMPELIDAFGPAIAAADGRLDRAVMRERAFGDPGARKRLESILHPMIRAAAERQVGESIGPYVITVVPLLIESGNWKQRADRVLVVDCPEDIQIERVMARSGLARDQVLAIIGAQASRDQRLAAADDVIDNRGEPGDLDAQIAPIHRRYVELAAEKAACGPKGQGR
jgi:dephospho-CoA kinase